MNQIVVTNNPMVEKKLSGGGLVDFCETDFLGVLKKVRDRIHLGHELYTHPLSSSLKPNETPYKSVMISREKSGSVDFNSLKIIEESIEVTEKFLRDRKTPDWRERADTDFQVIDLSVVEFALDLKKGI